MSPVLCLQKSRSRLHATSSSRLDWVSSTISLISPESGPKILQQARASGTMWKKRMSHLLAY